MLFRFKRICQALVIAFFAAWAWPSGLFDRTFATLTLGSLALGFISAALWWWAVVVAFDDV